MRRRYWFARALKVAVVVVIVLGVVSFVAMSLWNWLVPALFAGPKVTYWQALGLLVLSRLLFGGMHHRGPFGHGPFGRRHLHAHWKHMTPEERERVRENLRHRWSGSHWGGPRGGDEQPPRTSETHI
jgi:hypothetical protein